MFRRKAIDDWALDYWLLQQYAKFCFRIYFRKVEIVNRHNIPLNQPLILAPNHQNALIDAMVLVCNLPFQSVFLARADIFKGKRMTKFLTFLNIMPIYRIRDGIENVKRNDVVFEKTIKILLNRKSPLGLFAEGNHGDKRRLRPLVKGLFRIAFLTQETLKDQPGVKILPIGIDYGHYQNFRTTIFVNIGKPVEVSEYYKSWTENPVIGVNELKETFASALSKQMIDIQTEEYYDLYMNLREIFNGDMKALLGIDDNSLAAGFAADKEMITILNKELEIHPEYIKDLNPLVIKYQEDVRKAGLRDWVLKKNGYPLTGLILAALAKIILLPVYLFGFLNNYVPYWFVASKTKNIKDTQFHSSVKYVLGMVVFPVWYIILAGILAFLALPIWIILLYIFSLPFAGLAAFTYFIRFRKFIAKCRFNLLKDSPDLIALRNTRKTIIERMHGIIKRHQSAYEN